MASREFLKILSSARQGDVSAQQMLANAYLTGMFKTQIQPSNALIWLEKSYQALENPEKQSLDLENPKVLGIAEQVSQVPLAKVFNTPAFSFGWEMMWELSHSSINPSIQFLAKWQLADFLINPDYRETQLQINEWVKKAIKPSHNNRPSDLTSLQKLAKRFLQEVAESSQSCSQSAKELLIKLQPKNEVLSTLWNSWRKEKNEDALIQAAELGLTIAKLTLGLNLAQLNGKSTSKSNASLKKAAYWLEFAAKDGDRDAWYALGEIYRRPQFSGYNAQESDRCFDHAADLGHPHAQFRKGANLWRKREKIDEKIRGLQASYWVWQAHQQGIEEATQLLNKILNSCPNPQKNDWYELAIFADQAVNHHAEYKLDEDWLLLCHRIIIANQFNFTKAELLLAEVGQLQHEHCVAVDIRWELPKILPRLIHIETIQQRRALLAAGKIFAGSDSEAEGNLRQRRYRFDQVSNWLLQTFSKNQKLHCSLVESVS